MNRRSARGGITQATAAIFLGSFCLTGSADLLAGDIQVGRYASVRAAPTAAQADLLSALVALVDGFVQWDLRRWGGGRESSFVYHWAKHSALPLLVVSWVVYLALPFSLHPTFVILPFATLFALSVAVTASSFKK